MEPAGKTATTPRGVGLFTDSGAALFLGLAFALLLANWHSSGLAQPRDPVFGISMRNLFWIVCTLGLGVGCFCLFGEDARLKVILVMWLAANLLAYQCSFLWLHREFRGYLGSLADAFGLPTRVVADWAGILLACLLMGGCAVLLAPQRRRLSEGLAEDLKMSCPSCGGHIKFDAERLGQKIPCPHCQATITVRKPESVKMSCFFCKGHIEFPPHASGRKIACPHCKMDITLKVPDE